MKTYYGDMPLPASDLERYTSVNEGHGQSAG